MGTRSFICYENEETKKINITYCHFDGYIDRSGVGLKLWRYFNNKENAKKVASLKWIRSLGDDFKDKEMKKAWNERNDEKGIDPRDDVLIKGYDFSFYKNSYIDQFMFTVETEYANQWWVEYLYLWRKGQWWVSQTQSVSEDDFQLLNKRYNFSQTYLSFWTKPVPLRNHKELILAIKKNNTEEKKQLGERYI